MPGVKAGEEGFVQHGNDGARARAAFKGDASKALALVAKLVGDDVASGIQVDQFEAGETGWARGFEPNDVMFDAGLLKPAFGLGYVHAGIAFDENEARIRGAGLAEKVGKTLEKAEVALALALGAFGIVFVDLNARGMEDEKGARLVGSEAQFGRWAIRF